MPRHVEVPGVIAAAGNADQEWSAGLAPGEESGHRTIACGQCELLGHRRISSVSFGPGTQDVPHTGASYREVPFTGTITRQGPAGLLGLTREARGRTGPMGSA